MPARTTTGADEEFTVPQLVLSPVTGVTGAAAWGALNKFNDGSRWTIADADFDEFLNALPQVQGIEQVPDSCFLYHTAVGPIVNWWKVTVGNIAYVIYTLTSNAAYLVNLSVSPPTSTSIGTYAIKDVTVWQNTTVIFTDGTNIYSIAPPAVVVTTVFSAQPATSLAVYSGRLWGANNATVWWTNGGTYNSLGGDSGAFAIGDQDAATYVIRMVAFSGSLYIFGSGWVKGINNLIDVGNPSVLTFQQPTISGQCPLNLFTRYSIVEWNGSLFFVGGPTNEASFQGPPPPTGAYRLNGNSVARVSAAVDNFFRNVINTATNIYGAYVKIMGKECVVWNVVYQPDTTASWALNGNNEGSIIGVTEDNLWFRVLPEYFITQIFPFRPGATARSTGSGTTVSATVTTVASYCMIVVTVGWTGAQTISSVSVAGTAATFVKNQSQGSSPQINVAMYCRPAPIAGYGIGSVLCTATFSGSVASSWIDVFAYNGMWSADTGAASSSGASGTSSVTVTCPSTQDLVVVAGYGTWTTPDPSFTVEVNNAGLDFIEDAVAYNGFSNAMTPGPSQGSQWILVAGQFKMQRGPLVAIIGLGGTLQALYTDASGNIYVLFWGQTPVVTSQLNTKIWDLGSKLDFDWLNSLLIEYSGTTTSQMLLAEIGNSNTVQGPQGNAVLSIAPAAQLFNHAAPSSPPAVFSDQAVIPFQDRGMGLNMAFVGDKISLHAVVLSYRKMGLGKG